VRFTQPTRHNALTGIAIALVLGAASIHASWNYILKKSGGGIGFVWAFAALSALFYAPLALGVVLYTGFAFTPLALGCIAASAVLHTAYYLLLDRGYRHGDLSVIYPLARATGPLLTIAVAIALLGERPGAIALGGAAMVVGGAFFLAASPSRLRQPGALHGVGFALLTGCMIASYTVVDKQAVSAVLVPPLLLDWGANLGRVIVMAPLALRNGDGVRAAWRERRGPVIAVALLCPLSYIMVLTAMAFTPVSYVAPAREISILFAALMGAHWLREGDVARRVAAAVAMALGVVALALG
jgi:drug/metabolite transporter (DMT)-like permease